MLTLVIWLKWCLPGFSRFLKFSLAAANRKERRWPEWEPQLYLGDQWSWPWLERWHLFVQSTLSVRAGTGTRTQISWYSVPNSSHTTSSTTSMPLNWGEKDKGSMLQKIQVIPWQISTYDQEPSQTYHYIMSPNSLRHSYSPLLLHMSYMLHLRIF